MSTQTAAISSRGPSRRVLGVAFSHFAHDAYTSFLATFLPLLIERFSLPMTLAGMLSVFFRTPAATTPFLGFLSDRRNLVPFFVAAPTVSAICMTGLGLAPSYAAAALLCIITGLSSTFYHVVAPVLIARDSGTDLGRNMSLFMVAGELSRSAGPLIAVTALGWWGFEGIWPLLFGGFACSIMLYFQFGRRSAALSDSSKRPDSSLRETWQALRPVMLPLIPIMAARVIIVGPMMNFLPTFMVGQGHSIAYAGATLAAFELVGALGTFLGGTLSDRIGRRPVLAASLAVGPLGLILAANSSGALVFAGLAVIGLATFATAPVLLALVQEHAGERRGTANGLYMGVSFCLSATSITLFGALVDLSSFHTAYTASACLALAALPFLTKLPRG